MVPFSSIFCNLPEASTDLVSNQKYLYDICEIISSGDCSLELSKRHPKKLWHSRWMTTANRILRLHVGTGSASSELKCLSEFIVIVYVPIWFNIKNKSCGKNEAPHLFLSIKFSRYLNLDMMKVIDPKMQRNAYFVIRKIHCLQGLPMKLHCRLENVFQIE